MYGAKTQGLKKPKAWSEARDDKYDRSHGVKEGSVKDMSLDKKRGVKDADLETTLTKLRGGK